MSEPTDNDDQEDDDQNDESPTLSVAEQIKILLGIVRIFVRLFGV